MSLTTRVAEESMKRKLVSIIARLKRERPDIDPFTAVAADRAVGGLVEDHLRPGVAGRNLHGIARAAVERERSRVAVRRRRHA